MERKGTMGFKVNSLSPCKNIPANVELLSALNFAESHLDNTLLQSF
jgi:hypothetical protein